MISEQLAKIPVSLSPISLTNEILSLTARIQLVIPDIITQGQATLNRFFIFLVIEEKLGLADDPFGPAQFMQELIYMDDLFHRIRFPGLLPVAKVLSVIQTSAGGRIGTCLWLNGILGASS